jgi:hypothetical protein
MGQPVNPLLGNYQTMLGADPEMYRQQLIQQEQARIGALPAQSQLGATLGSLLGRGVVNVAQDRGFFEVTNPVLQKLTSIQNVYNTAMQNSDPNDPLSFFKNLETGFKEAPGLGVQALMANQERRRVEGDLLKTDALRMNYFKDNPDIINPEIDKLRAEGTPESLKRADALAELKTRISRDQEFKIQSGLLDIAAKQSTIKVNEAKIEEIRREAKEGKVQISQFAATTTSPAYVAVFRNGKLEEQYPIGTSALGEMPGTTPAKPGERPPLSSFAPGGAATTQTPAQAPAPQPRKVGAVEQQTLNRLEERRQGIAAAEQTIEGQRSQGRSDYNALVTRATELGLVPMGMSGSDVVFINPTTGQRILGSQL